MNCGSLAWGYGTDGSTDYFKVTHCGSDMGQIWLLQVAESCGCLASAVFFLPFLPSGQCSRRWNSCVIWVSSARRARDVGRKITPQVVAPLLPVAECPHFATLFLLLKF